MPPMVYRRHGIIRLVRVAGRACTRTDAQSSPPTEYGDAQTS